MKDTKMQITPAALSALANNDFENFVAAATPGGIEAQEARGQRDFVASETLPLKFNSGTRQELESMGVRFAQRDSVAPDSLFIGVELPDGWKVIPTDHSMWSKLVDDKGRERASLFYKAAFYDRDAFINVNARFSVSGYQPCDAAGNLLSYDDEHSHFATVIQDGGKTVKVIGVREDSEAGRALRGEHGEQAYAWLAEHYPDWKCRTAYWD